MRNYTIFKVFVLSVVSILVTRPAWTQVMCSVSGTAVEATSGGFVGSKNVPVFLHVITDNAGTAGYVSQPVIEDQIDVLNAEYGSIFNFELLGISYTKNSDWFTGVQEDESNEYRIAMTNALSIDPAHVLNIYTVGIYYSNPNSRFMGISKFPTEDESDPLHGVILDFRALPGMGGKAGLDSDQGDWAVHEVGHYFGLLHTFAGAEWLASPNFCVQVTEACAGLDPEDPDTTDLWDWCFFEHECEGDEDCYTPAHKQPTPAEQSSCNQLDCLGLRSAPNTNFMNYTDDECRTGFDSIQTGRMRRQVEEYRPSLGTEGGNNFYFSDDIQVLSDQTFTIFGLPGGGTTLHFASGKKLQVDGMLELEGTSTEPISLIATSTTWSGLYFASGSEGHLNHAVVDGVQGWGANAVYLNNADVWIDNSTIRNCSGACDGVSANSGSFLWLYHSLIEANDGAGVEVYNSDAYLVENNILDNSGYGVFASYFADPLFAYASGSYIAGQNTISGSDFGVYATNYASPVVGTGSGGLGYKNRLLGNTSYDAWTSINSDIMAKSVWWGAENCPPETIYGNVTWNPCLTSDPGAAFKSEATDPLHDSVDGDLGDLLVTAIEARHLGRTSEALSSLTRILTDAPETPEGTRALLELGFLYSGTEDPAVLNVLESQMSGASSSAALARAVLMAASLRVGDYRRSTELADGLIRDYPDTPHEKNALLALFHSHLETDDAARAGDALDTLVARYPDDHDVYEALHLARSKE